MADPLPEGPTELRRSRGRWPRTFDAFQDTNFRWFFISLFGSFSAMNMQMFVRGWLVFEITGSYEKLGWMTAAGGIVGLFAAPMGGVVADRVRQKKTIIQVCQGANALIALGIGVLVSLGMLEFVHLLTASILQGVSMSAMMPARQALTKDVVGIRRLTNAIALNTSGMNTARLLLPGLAGGMVAALGGGDGNIDPAQWVYYFMALLYLFTVVMLFKVKVEDSAQERPAEPMMVELVSGFRYVRETPVILMLLVCNFLMVFFSLTYFMLLPGFAKQVLDAGPDRLGILISISGVGSLVGSLLIASMGNRHRARVLLYGAMLLGISLVLFASSTNYWLSVALLTFVGLGQSARMSLSNVLIQSYVDDEYRGRVMSIYMLEMSVLAIAIYPISIVADRIGPQWAVGVSGACLILLVMILFLIPAYRDLD
ncbi:MAG: MFS transporter [bacterium]|nr:MFS transporter [Gammaproteobacteria bacterium]HIL94551.1 MFS transporter [Pseudomonadales bacterium]